MDSLAKGLSSKTSILGLKVSEVVGIAGIVLIFLFSLSLWLSLKKRSKCMALCNIQMPGALKEITVDLAKQIVLDAPQTTHEDIKKQVVVLVHGSTMTQRNFDKAEKDFGGWEPKRAAERKNNGLMNVANRTDPLCVVKDVMEGRKGGCHPHLAKVPHGNGHSCRPDRMPAEVSHMGLGQWYTLRELEAATGSFVNTNVLGEGGYGVVYLGLLADGTCVAVKKLFNNRGQAEREFKVEVEAIGRVWHKNLVRLTGYCMEGSQRMLVYEFVDNGNLSQWLHGSLGRNQPLPWDIRMKIILGTAKGLAYLHEGLEPKVVHRDVKSSNILIDSQWNAKVSDFGLAKLLGAENSHVTTRVMGTFGYVAPEYALTGMLTEKSDVYSYGVLVMEIVTGRVPVDYGRPVGEVNLVDWLKTMIGHRLFDEVADPRMQSKPSPRSLKRALLVALRCVDPDAQKRPKMGHVVHTLEADDGPVRRVPFG